jgi:hypothetical protein
MSRRASAGHGAQDEVCCKASEVDVARYDQFPRSGPPYYGERLSTLAHFRSFTSPGVLEALMLEGYNPTLPISTPCSPYLPFTSNAGQDETGKSCVGGTASSQHSTVSTMLIQTLAKMRAVFNDLPKSNPWSDADAKEDRIKPTQRCRPKSEDENEANAGQPNPYRCWTSA